MKKSFSGFTATRSEKILALKERVSNFQFDAETTAAIKSYIGRAADHMGDVKWAAFDVPTDREACLQWFEDVQAKANKGRKKGNTSDTRKGNGSKKVTAEITEAEQSLLVAVRDILSLTGETVEQYTERVQQSICQERGAMRAEAEQKAKEAADAIEALKREHPEVFAQFDMLQKAHEAAEKSVSKLTANTANTSDKSKGRRGASSRKPKESAASETKKQTESRADIRAAAYANNTLL